MLTMSLALKITAEILFILFGLGVPSSNRFNFLGWGLAFWLLSTILPAFTH